MPLKPARPKLTKFFCFFLFTKRSAFLPCSNAYCVTVWQSAPLSTQVTVEPGGTTTVVCCGGGELPPPSTMQPLNPQRIVRQSNTRMFISFSVIRGKENDAGNELILRKFHGWVRSHAVRRRRRRPSATRLSRWSDATASRQKPCPPRPGQHKAAANVPRSDVVRAHMAPVSGKPSTP